MFFALIYYTFIVNLLTVVFGNENINFCGARMQRRTMPFAKHTSIWHHFMRLVVVATLVTDCTVFASDWT